MPERQLHHSDLDTVSTRTDTGRLGGSREGTSVPRPIGLVAARVGNSQRGFLWVSIADEARKRRFRQRNVLSKGPSSHRSGQDAGQVQGTNAAQGAAAPRKRLRVAIADLDNLDDRLGSEHLAMRMGEPLAIGAHHAAAHACLVDGRLEIERIPLGHGLLYRYWIEFAAEQLLHPRLKCGNTQSPSLVGHGWVIASIASVFLLTKGLKAPSGPGRCM